VNPQRKKRVIETTFRVRFAETDQMGIVHHAAYAVYLEEGRVEWSRQTGMPYSAFEKAGYSLAVTELSLRYMTAARFDDLITVRAWVEELGSRGLLYHYEVMNAETRQKLVTAKTRLICVDRTGQVRRIPPEWFQRWQALIYEDEP
jgi:acyl-CoA thioester hydrolase